MIITHPDGMSRADRSTRSYAKWIDASRRVRWDIERDVIRGRNFDTMKKSLPDGLSKVCELAFLAPAEQRLLSQIQGRTYAHLLALIERAIAARMLDLSQEHRFGDQVAFEALVGSTEEVLKHQALFRRLGQLAGACLPAGYTFEPDPNVMVHAVLAHSAWAVLGLALDVEIFTLAHYRSSIDLEGSPKQGLDPLWADIFHFHWKEASQHAILDELEWRREHARLDAAQREQGVTDLLALLGTVDAMLVRQAAADARHFVRCAGRGEGGFSATEVAAVHDLVLRAYRWQYIVCGVQEPRFAEVMKELATPAQRQRLRAALEPLVDHVVG